MKKLLAWFSTIAVLACRPLLADINSDLLAYYPFNGNANDVTGNGYTGTMTDVVFTTDRFGNANSALRFNGISSDVEISNAFPMQAEQTFTLWVNPATAVGYQPLLEKAIPGVGGEVDFQLRLPNDGIPNDGTINFCANTDNGLTGIFASATSQTALPVGQWSFLTCVIDQANNQVLLYVNGILNGTASMGGRNIRNSNYPFRIGKQIGQEVNISFNGSIDDVRIYNRALAVSEVAQLYNVEDNNLTAALQSVSTAQTQLPVYGICPVPDENQDSLVFITHGWINPDIETIPQAISFVSLMSNSVAQYLLDNSLNNWKVQGYLWTNLAYIPIHDGGPATALNHAEQQGKMIGDSIVQSGYTHVHFIAHSAGAGLIQKATEEIRAKSLVPVIIHCTFLDAYDGVFSEMAYEYGAEADWSDSYFVRDEFQKYGWTGVVLPNAYNFDVTTLDPSSSTFPWYESLRLSCSELESNHGWPPEFYQNSTAGAITGNSPSGYNDFGFPLSEEAGTIMSSAKDEYPPGNGVLYGSVMVVGPENGCIPPYVIPSQYIGTVPRYSTPSTIESSTGTLQTSPGTAQVGTGSPVWLATVIIDTNALNYVSFDAVFTSAGGADGLLTVYWDTNMIGEVDEAAVLPGLQHYNMQFLNTDPNTSHVLGFHVDPFTEAHSTLLLTNIVTGFAGVSQAPTLTVTNGCNGLAYQLTGQRGTYAVQSSRDLLNWTTIAYLANSNGLVNFVDPNWTNQSHQFYRATSSTMMSQ